MLRPARILLLLIAAQFAVWTLVPALLATSLPLDMTGDLLPWGHEWQLGYYKHPPLPAWMAEIAFTALGNFGAFLLSQICVALTFFFAFKLAREFLDEAQAVLATLLLAGVLYFSLYSPEFNNNIAQMPLWAAAVLALRKGLSTGQARWWTALGVTAGLGMLAKYSTATLLLAMVVWLLFNATARKALARPATYLAPLAALAVFAPHLVWLVQNDFPTLHYAQARAGHAFGIGARLSSMGRFAVAQLLDLALVFALWALALFAGKASRRPRDQDFDFLLVMGLGPVLVTLLLPLALGYGIRDMWAAPMWNLIGLLLIAAVKWEKPEAALRRVAQGALALFVILPVAFAFTNFIGPHMRGHASRMGWPDRAMARRLDADWAAATGAPLAIVAGDPWTAGLVALRLSPRASVYTDANPAYAPWITPDRIAREGLLAVWRAKDDGSVPADLASIPELKVMGVECFAWPGQKEAKHGGKHKDAPLRIGWAIVVPESQAKSVVNTPAQAASSCATKDESH